MDAFREVYDRHYGAVHRFALFLTGNAAQADDLTADTFVRAWLAWDRIRQPTVRQYLLTIARNLYRDYVRANPRPHDPLDDNARDERPGADVRIEHRSDLQQLRTRLKRVARGDRRALLLYVAREQSYAEIATALGISIGAVKSRIARARDILRASEPAIENGETPT